MLSDKEIKDLMFKIEKHPDTFKHKVQGVSLFFLLRFAIETGIRETKAPFSLESNQAITSSRFKKTAAQIVHKIRTRIINLKFRFLITLPEKLEKTSHLFFTHIDITHKKHDNMSYILKYYARKNFPTPLISTSFTAQTIKPSYITDLYFFFSFKAPESPPTFSLQAFLMLLTKITSIDFSRYEQAWKSNIQNQLINASRLEHLITQSQCKYLFCSSAYTFPWILLACHRTQTKSIEIQHGVMPQDLVYYDCLLPENKLSPETLLMPSYILTLGQKWKDIVTTSQHLYHHSNTFVLGSGAFNPYSGYSPTHTTRPLNILVAVQPGIYDLKAQLLELATQYQAMLIQQGITFTIRPHPLWNFDEYRQICKKYSRIFRFDNSRKNHLYKSLQKAQIVLANTSMCLYEALAMGKTALSFDNFKGQTIPDHIKFVKTVEELFNYLVTEHSNSRITKHSEYLSTFNQSVLDKFCE